MINNTKKILENLQFSNRYCYTLEIQLRKKDNYPENFTILDSPIKNKNHFKEVMQTFTKICDKLEARIYLLQVPIYYDKFAELLKKRASDEKITDIMLYDLYGNYNCENVFSHEYKLIDIDEKELDFFNNVLKKDIDENYKSVYYVPTVNGYHIVGKYEDIENIIKKHSKSEDKLHGKFHNDCRVLVYTPLERKATV